MGRASGDTDVPELRHFPASAAAVTSDLEAVFCHGVFAVCCAKPVEPVPPVIDFQQYLSCSPDALQKHHFLLSIYCFRCLLVMCCHSYMMC